MTREELLTRMSNREFQEWFVYWQLHPFGEKREDLRAGIQWATHINLTPRKDHRTISPMDYPLILAAKTRQEKAKELHSKFRAFKQQYEARKAQVS